MMLPHILAIATNHVTPLIVGVAQRLVAVFLSDELREKRKKPKISDSPSNSTNTNVNESLLKVLGEQQQRIADLKAQELDIQETALNIQKAIAIDNSEYREKLLALEHKKLRLQESMARVDRDFQAKQSALYRELLQKHKEQEIAIQLTNLQGYWDREKLPTILSRAELKSILVDGQQQLRLLMLLSKPEVSEACPAFLKEELGMEVENELKQFMQQRYPDTSKKSPVRFYSRFFSQAVFDLEIEQLRNILAPVPTAIIYSNVTSRKVFFHISFLGLSGHSTLNITESLDWRSLSQQLKAENSEISDETILCEICDLIVVLNKLLAAFLADLYYLIEVDPYYEPQLFQMDLGLPLEAATSFIQPYVDLLKEIQQQQLQVHEREIKMLQQAQVWKCVNTFTGFSDSLYSIEISPDGQMLLGSPSPIMVNYEVRNYLGTEKCQKQVFKQFTKIWNLPTGKLISALPYNCAFTPDSEWLIYAADQYSKKSVNWKTLEILDNGQDLESIYSVQKQVFTTRKSKKLFDAYTGIMLRKFSGEFKSFSPDGHLFASSTDDHIMIWNSNNGQLLHSLSAYKRRYKFEVIFSHDNQLVVVISKYQEKTEVWNLLTGELVCNLSYDSEKSFFTKIAFNPDGTLLAVAYENDKSSFINIYNPYTGDLLRSLPSSNCVRDISFTPNGQMLVSRQDDNIKIFNSQTGNLLHTLSVKSDYFKFSPNNSLVICAHYFSTSVFNIHTGKLLQTIPHKIDSFSPDEEIFIIDGGNKTQLWNSCTGELLSELEGKFEGFSPDGKILATKYQDFIRYSIHLWDLNTRKLIYTISEIFHVLSPDWQTFVTKSLDTTSGIWDLQIRNRDTGKLLQTLPGHSGGIQQVVFSNDGQTMVSLGGDLTLKVWKREPEELLEEDSNRD
jgi:WD40 repeat protein